VSKCWLLCTSGSQIDCVIVKRAQRWGSLHPLREPSHSELWAEVGLERQSKASVLIVARGHRPQVPVHLWQNHLLRYIKPGKPMPTWLSTHIPFDTSCPTPDQKEKVCLMTQWKAFVRANTNTPRGAISTRMGLSAPPLGAHLSACLLDVERRLDNTAHT